MEAAGSPEKMAAIYMVTQCRSSSNHNANTPLKTNINLNYISGFSWYCTAQ